MRSRFFDQAAFVAVTWLLMAGHAHAVSIQEIIDDPRTYVDRTVTLDGNVTGRLSLFVLKYFTVNDGTGVINVVTERPLPRQGQKIRVVGKVKEVLSLGRETLLVLVEDTENDSSAQSDKHRKPPSLPGAI